MEELTDLKWCGTCGHLEEEHREDGACHLGRAHRCNFFDDPEQAMIRSFGQFLVNYLGMLVEDLPGLEAELLNDMLAEATDEDLMPLPIGEVRKLLGETTTKLEVKVTTSTGRTYDFQT